MVREKFAVRLTPEERDRLEHLVRAGRSPARVATRARILLKTSEGWSAPKVAQALDVAESSVYRIKRRFSKDGLDGVLQDRPQANRYRKLDDRAGAHLIALTCTPAPEGHDHWTLRALAGRAVELGLVTSLSHESVRRHLKKNTLKPWQRKQWCIPEVSADFVAHMEDVLDLYAEPYDPARPVVCFDETSTQLLADARPPIPAKPGRPRREDYEYVRGGTRNLFLTCEPLAGWRHVEITERRTKLDFAHQMRWLVVEAYPEAEVIRVVLDNLNTHRKAPLYEAFPAAEARRIARKLEFHYTPKHGSWLNMAEIEFSVISRRCLGQRHPDEDSLCRGVHALEQERNEAQAIINWQFTTQDARTKLHRLYPSIPSVTEY